MCHELHQRWPLEALSLLLLELVLLVELVDRWLLCAQCVMWSEYMWFKFKLCLFFWNAVSIYLYVYSCSSVSSFDPLCLHIGRSCYFDVCSCVTWLLRWFAELDSVGKCNAFIFVALLLKYYPKSATTPNAAPSLHKVFSHNTKFLSDVIHLSLIHI